MLGEHTTRRKNQIANRKREGENVRFEWSTIFYRLSFRHENDRLKRDLQQKDGQYAELRKRLDYLELKLKDSVRGGCRDSSESANLSIHFLSFCLPKPIIRSQIAKLCLIEHKCQIEFQKPPIL